MRCVCGGKTGGRVGSCVNGMAVDGEGCVVKCVRGVARVCVAGGRCGVLAGLLVGRECGVDGGVVPVWAGLVCCV